MSRGTAAALSKPGRIIVGSRSLGLTELTLNSARPSTLSLEAEEVYLQRVRTKAHDMAREILAQAMVEGEALRREAQEHGLREGAEKAEAEVKKFLQQKRLECEALLASMHQASHAAWKVHRQDLVLLVQVVVEKILSVELSNSRRESLENLLDQAVDMMDVKRRVVITVHPRDQELMEELLQGVKTVDGGVQGCKVKTDERVEPGGLILECDHGMVDNTIASRKASLQEILDQLTLEETG